MSTTATASSSSRTIAPSRPRRNPARTVRHRAGPRRPTGTEYRSLQSRRVTKDDLHDFQRTSFTWEGTRHDVFRRGSGPAVLVTSEIPGITPVSYTHLRAHETPEHLVCRLLLEQKKRTRT